jgi:hypothetical protein
MAQSPRILFVGLCSGTFDALAREFPGVPIEVAYSYPEAREFVRGAADRGAPVEFVVQPPQGAMDETGKMEYAQSLVLPVMLAETMVIHIDGTEGSVNQVLKAIYNRLVNNVMTPLLQAWARDYADTSHHNSGTHALGAAIRTVKQGWRYLDDEMKRRVRLVFAVQEVGNHVIVNL